MLAEDFLDAVDGQSTAKASVDFPSGAQSAEEFLDAHDPVGTPFASHGGPSGSFGSPFIPSSAPQDRFGVSSAGQMLAPSNGEPAIQAQGDPSQFAWAPEGAGNGPSFHDTADVAGKLLKLGAGSALETIGTGVRGIGKVLQSLPGDSYGMAWATTTGDAPVSTLSDLGQSISTMGEDLKSSEPALAAHWAGKAAETGGSLAGLVGSSLINPTFGASVFAGGSGEYLAKKAEEAGKPQEIVDQARATGAVLGLAAAYAPITQVTKLFSRFNINPYVRSIAKDLAEVMPSAPMQARLIATGVEAAKTAGVGASVGAGYQVGMNALENGFSGSNIPLTQNVPETAAFFGLPSGVAGGAAAFRASGRVFPFEPFFNVKAEPGSPVTTAEAFLDAPSAADPVSDAHAQASPVQTAEEFLEARDGGSSVVPVQEASIAETSEPLAADRGSTAPVDGQKGSILVPGSGLEALSPVQSAEAFLDAPDSAASSSSLVPTQNPVQSSISGSGGHLLSPEEFASAAQFVQQPGKRALSLLIGGIMQPDGTLGGGVLYPIKQQRNGKLTSSPEEILQGLHEQLIEQAIKQRSLDLADMEGPYPGLVQASSQRRSMGWPISAKAIDAYGIKLPEGYIRMGDHFVYNPSSAANQPAPMVASPISAVSEVSGEIANPDNPRAPKEIKQDILGHVDRAIVAAPEVAHGFRHPNYTVEFRVPGDGTFKLVNDKATLKEFRKRVAKLETRITPSTASASKTALGQNIEQAAFEAAGMYGGERNAVDVLTRQLETQSENLDARELERGRRVVSFLSAGHDVYPSSTPNSYEVRGNSASVLARSLGKENQVAHLSGSGMRIFPLNESDLHQLARRGHILRVRTPDGIDVDSSTTQALKDLYDRPEYPQPDSPEIQADRGAGGPPPKQQPVPANPTPEPEEPFAAKESSPRTWTVRVRDGISAYTHSKLLPVRKALFPASLGETASQMAHIIRDWNGTRSIAIQRADAALSKWRTAFDKTPVLRSWSYNPAEALPSNYAFIQAVETGKVSALPQEQQELAALMRKQLDERIGQVQELNPESLKSLIENYFPHVWCNPSEASSKLPKVGPASKPMEGSRSFLKRRVLTYFTDGLKAGLVPVSDNPVDIHLFKLAEMDRFIMAQNVLKEAKSAGLRKFVGVFQPKPEGWSKVEDPTTTVFHPPFVTVKEAFDLQLRQGALDLIKRMGWNYERTLQKLKAKGFEEGVWGFWHPGEKAIKQKSFTGDVTLFHEIGHGLDHTYGLSDWMTRRIPEAIQKAELKALSDAREPNTTVYRFGKLSPSASEARRQYIHSRSEQMAEITAAYIHAPELLQKLAPNIAKAYRAFLDAHPDLWDFRDLRPSLERGSEDVEVPVHGLITLGHWYMPDGAAQVLTNYLSPGLSNKGWYRSIRSVSNLLNSATLGLSAFHLGFTSVEAMASQVSIGLWQALNGHPMRGAKSIATAPLAPVTNYVRGRRLQRAMLQPDQATEQMKAMADLALKGGLRATIDPFWKTEFTRNFRKALAGVRMNLSAGKIPKGEALSVISNLLPMVIEQAMRPISEFVVPRQKLGVFAELMHAEMQRLGPDASLADLRAAASRSADSTEDRLGQMTYDNLFHNKVAKDLLLVAFRAYGWQLGKYRAIAKATGETMGAAKDLLRGKKPSISTNLTYFPALVLVAGILGAITQKILSGKDPESLKDFFLPRSGKVDAHGREQRLALPTYLKDLISDWHDAPDLRKMGASFWHKLNPALSIVCDAFNNKDFYGTEIRHDDDPAWKQALQLGQFLAKSFIPFSIVGTMRLREQGAGVGEQALPYIGIVPAKRDLTMTPAEVRAEDLYVGTFPRGARTQDQADHSHVISLIKQQMYQDPVSAVGMLSRNASSLHRLDLKGIQKDQGIPQIVTRVQRLTLEQGMSVFDLGNELERRELAPELMKKLGRAVNARSIAPEIASRYAKVLTSVR